MKERQDHLPRDLQALRYLDALDAGDLETVAALWDEARDDAELEAMLADIDSTLVAEVAVGNCNSSNAQMRPTLQGSSTSPTSTRSQIAPRQWHWGVAVGGLAAACLLAISAWQARIGERPIVKTATPELVQPVKPRTPIDSAGIAALRESWRILEGEDASPFVWPLPMSSLTASTSIPADLFH